jgi:uncharacterized protein
MDRFLPPLVLVVIGAAAHFAFSPSVAGTPRVLVYLLVPYALLSGLALWRMWRDGTLLDLFRFRSGDIALGVMAAVGLGVAVFVGRTMIAPSGSPAEAWVVRVYLQLGPVPADRSANLLFGAAIVAVALLEELVWRGMVQQVLEEQLSVRGGWLATTALYGLAHVPAAWQLAMPPAGANPLLPLAALFCGSVWGFLSARKQRLPPSLISHAIFTYALTTQFRLWTG